MLGSLLNSVTETASNFVRDPIGTTVNTALQPVADTIDVVDGLTEGELRHEAALRVGADVAAGMALNELIEVITD